MTGTLFQFREDEFDRWPRRPERSDPPRCARCGCDLAGEDVSVLSRHCRACLDVITQETKDDPS